MSTQRPFRGQQRIWDVIYGRRPRPVAHLEPMGNARDNGGFTRSGETTCPRMDVESPQRRSCPPCQLEEWTYDPVWTPWETLQESHAMAADVLNAELEWRALCAAQGRGFRRRGRTMTLLPTPGGTRPVGQPDPWPHLATILPGRRTHRRRVAQRMGGRRPSPSSPHTKTSLARTTCIVPSSSVARFPVAPSP